MSAPYITPAGYRALKAEHAALWARRREVVQALAAAAAEGDRSENAEYIYRKKELRGIDRRLRYLGRRLQTLKVADGRPADTGRVYFGARVTLEDEAGQQRCVRIVGSDEIDAARGHVSVDAPLARALLGRELDAEVTVRLPGGEQRFIVTAIEYAVEVE